MSFFSSFSLGILFITCLFLKSYNLREKVSVCLLSTSSVYGFCLSFLRGLYFFFAFFLFSFQLPGNYLPPLAIIFHRLNHGGSGKQNPWSKRERFDTWLALLQMLPPFVFLFILVFQWSFLFVFVFDAGISIGSQLPSFVFADLLAIDRKQKQN